MSKQFWEHEPNAMADQREEEADRARAEVVRIRAEMNKLDIIQKQEIADLKTEVAALRRRPRRGREGREGNTMSDYYKRELERLVDGLTYDISQCILRERGGASGVRTEAETIFDQREEIQRILANAPEEEAWEETSEPIVPWDSSVVKKFFGKETQ